MQHNEHIFDCQRHSLIPSAEYRSWLRESIEANTEKWRQEFAKCLFGEEYTGPARAEKKEAHAMNALKVEYNGFTGELVKLERKDLRVFGVEGSAYSLVIEDKEKHAKYDFDNVNLEDVKFLGGAVTFCV